MKIIKQIVRFDRKDLKLAIEEWKKDYSITECEIKYLADNIAELTYELDAAEIKSPIVLV